MSRLTTWDARYRCGRGAPEHRHRSRPGRDFLPPAL